MSISRRTVVKGAAWSVPTISVVATAPALAVSPTPLDIALESPASWCGECTPASFDPLSLQVVRDGVPVAEAEGDELTVSVTNGTFVENDQPGRPQITFTIEQGFASTYPIVANTGQRTIIVTVQSARYGVSRTFTLMVPA